MTDRRAARERQKPQRPRAEHEQMVCSNRGRRVCAQRTDAFRQLLRHRFFISIDQTHFIVGTSFGNASMRGEPMPMAAP